MKQKNGKREMKMKQKNVDDVKMKKDEIIE